jgi:hypothetical protein
VFGDRAAGRGSRPRDAAGGRRSSAPGGFGGDCVEVAGGGMMPPGKSVGRAGETVVDAQWIAVAYTFPSVRGEMIP